MQSGTQTTLDSMIASTSRPVSQCSMQTEADSVISRTSDSVSVVSSFTSTSRSSSSLSSRLIQPTIDQSIRDLRSYESKWWNLHIQRNKNAFLFSWIIFVLVQITD